MEINCVLALHNWGISLQHRAKMADSFNEIDGLLIESEQKFREALEIDTKDATGLFMWGIYNQSSLFTTLI
jgi:hypothetical protein